MSEVIAIAPFTIQDAEDGPGALTQAEKGLIFAWDGERMIVIPPQTIAQQAQPVLLRAGGGAWNIQNAVDGPGTLGSADNGKALSWSNSAGRFVMATLNAADADTLDGHDSTYFLAASAYTAADVLTKLLTVDGSGSGLDADTIDGVNSTAFLLADGSRTGATSQAQIFTTGVGIGSGITSPATLFQVVDTSTSSPRGIMSSQYNTGTDGARFHMRKGRGTLASPTTVVSGDTLGRLVASGYDGSAYQEMASIAFVSSGTVASTRVPTEIQFYTATNAAPSVMTQRMVIDNAGNVGIANTSPSQALDVTGSVKFSGALIGPAWKPASDSTTAIQLQNAAGTAIATLDTTNSYVGIKKTPTVIFDMQSDDTPATSIAAHISNTGSVELITNTTDRDFSGAGNWTGTNWAINSGAFKHTTGSTADAVLANANLTASSIISGRQYRVTFTVSGRTAGSVTAKLGTVADQATSANGTITQYITPTSNNVNLIFTPTSAFDGSIDDISVQRVISEFVVLNNGNVGIGRNDPQRPLDIKTATNGNVTMIGIYNAGTVDPNGVVISFRSDSTGTGATTYKEYGAMRHRFTTHDNATVASEYAFFNSVNGSEVQAFTMAGTGMNAVGISTPAAKWHVAGALSSAAWGLAGIGTQVAAATYTDTSTAGSGTATNAVANSFAQPTFAATNSSVTITNAATLYVADAPANGSNVTATNKYALWVDNGDVRFDGNIGFFATTPAAQQVCGANLTNNVTSGGSNNTIANFTDLSTYANDAATIRNNQYQLARSVKIIQDALRLYGLLS